MSPSLTTTLLIGFASVSLNATPTADWTQFRGPLGNGVVHSASAPSAWSTETNMAWQKPLPGAGWSSPLVLGDKVFVTTAVHEGQERPKGFQDGVRAMGNYREAAKHLKQTEFKLLCLSLGDGSTVWDTTVETEIPAFGIHPSNTYATESPATDGDSVFVFFPAAGSASCLDQSGQIRWTYQSGRHQYGNGFGSGSGLAYHDGMVFLQCDNDEDSYVVALEADSGSEVWKAKRQSRTSWSTPVIWKTGQREELVVGGSGHLTSYNPKTGSQNWYLHGIGGSFSSSPAFDEAFLFFGNSGPGSAGPLGAVAAGASGDLQFTQGNAEAWVEWSLTGAGPGLASPLTKDGLLYVIDGSLLNCYDGTSGKRIYKERLPGAGRFAASLWSVGDYLYALDENGKTFVIKMGREFEVIQVNDIDDLFWSTPSVAGNSMLLRGADRLYCIREADPI